MVEAQMTANIRAYVLDRRHSSTSSSAFLLGAWKDVLDWRRELEAYSATLSLQLPLLHAHSFAAGMAGVRGEQAVVYDLRNFVDQQAAVERVWLSRSFRAAEQFVFSRAGAVVVHEESLRRSCLARGADESQVFMVPDPVFPSETHGLGASSDASHRFAPGAFRIFADAASAIVLPALARLAQQGIAAQAIVCSSSTEKISAAELHGRIQALGLEHWVRAAEAGECASANVEADLVIADAPPAAIRAMNHQRALLAADVAELRAVSPDGRGCLWYEAQASPGSVQSLASRIAFLMKHADFRLALGESARRHITETRGPEKVGLLYENVYAHAWTRKQQGRSPHDRSGSFVPQPSGA